MKNDAVGFAQAGSEKSEMGQKMAASREINAPPSPFTLFHDGFAAITVSSRRYLITSISSHSSVPEMSLSGTRVARGISPQFWPVLEIAPPCPRARVLLKRQPQ